jgi:hypothetical protein
MFEFKKTSECTLKKIINAKYKETSGDTKILIKKVMDTKVSKDNIAQFLCMGNLYIALNEKINSKLSQIDKYMWLTQNMISICHKNLKKNINENPIFECPIGNEESDNNMLCYKFVSNLYGTIIIDSRIDCIDDKTLWEFKCVGSLQSEHLLQLVIYAWIWKKSMEDENGIKKFKILNIRTGEVQKLKYLSYHIEEIISVVLENKYYVKPKNNDVLFIKNCKKLREKFIIN